MTIRKSQIVKLKPWDRKKSKLYKCSLLGESTWLRNKQCSPDSVFEVRVAPIPWKVMASQEDIDKWNRYIDSYNDFTKIGNKWTEPVPPPRQLWFTHVGWVILSKDSNEYPNELMPAGQGNFDALSKVYKLLIKPNLARY